jgi:hypothetical protein
MQGFVAGGIAENVLTERHELSPAKFDRLLDIGVKALMHRAGVRCFFEGSAVRFADRMRHMDLDGQPLNPAYRSVDHFLLYCRRGSGQVDVERARCDSHNRQDAAPESGCHQIRGRKAFAPALIIFGCVGGEDCSGGAVDCLAVKISLILELDGDH